MNISSSIVLTSKALIWSYMQERWYNAILTDFESEILVLSEYHCYEYLSSVVKNYKEVIFDAGRWYNILFTDGIVVWQLNGCSYPASLCKNIVERRFALIGTTLYVHEEEIVQSLKEARHQRQWCFAVDMPRKRSKIGRVHFYYYKKKHS